MSHRYRNKVKNSDPFLRGFTSLCYFNGPELSVLSQCHGRNPSNLRSTGGTHSKGQNANSSFPFHTFQLPFHLLTALWIALTTLTARIQSPHQLLHHRGSQGYCHSDFCEPVPAPTNFTKKQWTAKKSPGMLAVTDPGQMWSGVLEVKGSLRHYRPSKFPSPRGVLSWEEKPVSDHARYFLRCPAVIPEDVLQMFVFVWNIQ